MSFLRLNCHLLVFLFNLIVGEKLATKVGQLRVDRPELRDHHVASTSLVEEQAPKSQNALLLLLFGVSSEVSILHSVILLIGVRGVCAVKNFRTTDLIHSQLLAYFGIHFLLWDVTKKGLIVLPHCIDLHLPLLRVLIDQGYLGFIISFHFYRHIII